MKPVEVFNERSSEQSSCWNIFNWRKAWCKALMEIALVISPWEGAGWRCAKASAMERLIRHLAGVPGLFTYSVVLCQLRTGIEISLINLLDVKSVCPEDTWNFLAWKTGITGINITQAFTLRILGSYSWFSI